MIKKPSFTQADVAILTEQPVYEGFGQIIHYRLQHRLFKGGKSAIVEREIYQRPNAVAVIPYDPRRRQVVLIEQFRAGAIGKAYSPWLLEVVAGLIQPGELAPEVAVRELQEETGLMSQAILPVYRFMSTPGSCSEEVSLYCSCVDTTRMTAYHGLAHEQEDIRCIAMSIADAYAALATGRIANAFTLIALQWLQLNEPQLQQLWAPKA